MSLLFLLFLLVAGLLLGGLAALGAALLATNRRRETEGAGAAGEAVPVLPPPGARRRLEKSRTPVLAGVCGGLAEWLGWDPTLVRVGYALATLLVAGFPGIILYLILALVMPAPAGAPPAMGRLLAVAAALLLGLLLLLVAVVGLFFTFRVSRCHTTAPVERHLAPPPPAPPVQQP